MRAISAAMELTESMSERVRPRLLRDRAAEPDGAEDDDRKAFDRRIVRGASLTSLVVAATLIGAWLVWELRVIFLLIVFSLFAAAMLHPIVNWVQGLGLKRRSERTFSRATGTVIVFFTALVVVGALLAVLIDPVVNSASHFVKELPSIVKQAQNGTGQVGRLVKRFHLLNFVHAHQSNLQDDVTKLSKPAFAIGKTVVSGVASAVTVVFLTFFILLDFPPMVRALLDWLSPSRSRRLRAVLDDVGKAVVGFVMANILTSVIAGMLVGLTLFLVGVPFWQVMALWVAFVDFLPLVGGLLAGVPVVVIAFLHSVPAGIIVLVVFIVYQEIENHLLNPIIMSRTVRLNPLAVLVAVLVGAQLGDLVGSVFGAFLGALLAVPVACAAQVIARDLWQHREPRGELQLPPG
jgi:predicted PurR-regulated permease PerM